MSEGFSDFCCSCRPISYSSWNLQKRMCCFVKDSLNPGCFLRMIPKSSWIGTCCFTNHPVLTTWQSGSRHLNSSKLFWAAPVRPSYFQTTTSWPILIFPNMKTTGTKATSINLPSFHPKASNRSKQPTGADKAAPNGPVEACIHRWEAAFNKVPQKWHKSEALAGCWKMDWIILPHSTWKWMIGILVSFWDCLFSGAMLVSGSVHFEWHLTMVYAKLYCFQKKTYTIPLRKCSKIVILTVCGHNPTTFRGWTTQTTYQ